MSKLHAWSLMVSTLSAAIALASCSSTNPTSQLAPPDNRAADEAAIRAADAAWSKAAEAKDLAGTTSFYADNAQLMAAGSPVGSGKDAIQKGFTAMMADKNFALKFAPTKVEVARSGDLAYDVGTYELVLSDKKGKPFTTKAMYLVVWGKQADGSWKALVDAPTTTTQ